MSYLQIAISIYAVGAALFLFVAAIFGDKSIDIDSDVPMPLTKAQILLVMAFTWPLWIWYATLSICRNKPGE